MYSSARWVKSKAHGIRDTQWNSFDCGLGLCLVLVQTAFGRQSTKSTLITWALFWLSSAIFLRSVGTFTKTHHDWTDYVHSFLRRSKWVFGRFEYKTYAGIINEFQLAEKKGWWSWSCERTWIRSRWIPSHPIPNNIVRTSFRSLESATKSWLSLRRSSLCWMVVETREETDSDIHGLLGKPFNNYRLKCCRQQQPRRKDLLFSQQHSNQWSANILTHNNH